jgi:hypothetical protein
MSTIEQAFNKMRERVKPAVLDHTSFANGNILKAYLEAKGFDFNTATDDEFANALYEAVTVEAAKLKWLTLPKKLQLENAAPRNETLAKREQDDFNARAKKAEADKAYQKKQDAALRQINDLIASFQLMDGITGKIKHGATDAIKERARKHLAKAQENKRDLNEVARELRAFFQDVYEKDERSRERV